MTAPDPVPPLLVSRDPGLLEALDRLAAAAGARPATAADPATALASWREAPLVLVGSDLVEDIAAVRPTRREGVYVVGCAPVGGDLFRHALAVGAEAVVDLPGGDAWLIKALTDAEEGAGRAPAPVLGVIGGSGGVGASTLAAAVAVAASLPRRGSRASEGGPGAAPARDAAAARDPLRACLVDADPLGGGAERLLGVEPAQGTHWARMAETSGRLGAGALSRALPRAGRVGVLGWGPGRREGVDPAVAREAVNAARRASSLVVVDLPRYPGPMSRELLSRCDDLVVVAGCSVHAAAACAQVLDSLQAAVRHHLVVRAGGSALTTEDVARVLGRPLCAVLGTQRGLEEAVALQLGPLRSRRGPLARAARAVLAVVGADLSPVAGRR